MCRAAAIWSVYSVKLSHRYEAAVLPKGRPASQVGTGTAGRGAAPLPLNVQRFGLRAPGLTQQLHPTVCHDLDT